MVTAKNKYRYGLAIYAFSALYYLVANHYHLFPPRLLPMTWIDQAIPFYPHTVWIYISEWLFFTVFYVWCKKPDNLSRFFYSFLSIQIFSIGIFWFWPTTYPRELFPLPNTLDNITYFAFEQLRATDTPANCFPSLHVSSVYLCALIFWDEDRKKFPILFVWANLIVLSTMTAKQHYLVDVMGGSLVALVGYYLFHRKLRPLPPVKTGRR